jgi:hypothetical protein
MELRKSLEKVEDLALTTVAGGRSNWTSVTSRFAAYTLVGFLGLSVLADVMVKDREQVNYVSLLDYVGMSELSDILYSKDRGPMLDW